MPLANVTLLNTFDEWRVRTNEIIYKLDAVETANANVYFVSNTSTINVTGIVSIGNTVYIDSNAFPTTGGTITGDVVIGGTTIYANGTINML